MDLKKILKKAFDAGYDTSVMYNCGNGNAYEDFESFYINEIKQSEQFFCCKNQIKQRCSEQCLGCFQFEHKD